MIHIDAVVGDLNRGSLGLRACLFGMWLAGCAGKAAMQRKLLCRESCCSELNRLASCLAGWLCVDELSEMPSWLLT
jgi:hypothetical protein